MLRAVQLVAIARTLQGLIDLRTVVLPETGAAPTLLQVPQAPVVTFCWVLALAP